MPPFNLNKRTDVLLKEEFDEYRKKGEPHPIFSKNNLSNIIPFDSDLIEEWREAQTAGVQYKHEFPDGSHVTVCGGIDDVLFNTDTKELVMIDYKSTWFENVCQDSEWILEHYWNYDVKKGDYKRWYKYQLNFYAHLFRKNGYSVSNTAYIYLVHADNNQDTWDNKINFEATLIPANLDPKIYDINQIINNVNETMESNCIPPTNPDCRTCFRESEIIDKAYSHGLTDGVQQGMLL